MKRSFVTWLIFLNAFAVGSVLMGFEMLGSRYLFPYFGGGIGTWAGLISIVLVALTVGYFLGGIIVDRDPSPKNIAIAILAAAAWLAVVPSMADPVNGWIVANLGDGALGILVASSLLLLIPASFLGTLTPMAVRLLVRSTSEAGRTAGLVYAVSTVGNVFGTLFTTFVLIPEYGSRHITYIYAIVLAVCGVSLMFVSGKRK